MRLLLREDNTLIGAARGLSLQATTPARLAIVRAVADRHGAYIMPGTGAAGAGLMVTVQFEAACLTRLLLRAAAGTA